MPLEFFDQLDIMRNTLSKGDFNLLVRAIKDPHLLTPDEAGTVGDSLGMSNGWKKWVTNLASDPTVWIATLLAARYPVSLWSHGIPKRLIGTGNEFAGLSRIFRPVVQAFRGTGIEESIALGMHRQAQVNMLAQPTYRALGSLSKVEGIALTRFREESLREGVTPNVLEADKRMTEFFQQMWAKLSTTADVQGSAASGNLSWGGFTKRTAAGLAEDPRVPLNFRNLMPHLPIMSTEGTMTISGSEALTRMYHRGGKAMQSAMGSDGFAPAKFARRVLPDGSPHPTDRIVSQMGPWRVNAADQIESSLADFDKLVNGTTGKLFFSHLKHRTRDLTIHGTGQGLFLADVNQIFAHYVRGASRTFAWNAPLTAVERKVGSFLVENPNPRIRVGRFFQDRMITRELGPEPLMVQIQKKALESMGVRVEQSVVKGTEGWNRPRTQIQFKVGDTPAKLQALEHLTRSLKGTYNEKDIIFGSLFSSIATQAERVIGAVSPGASKQLATHFEYLKSASSDRAKNNFLATYSYYTTLGGNLGPAFGNSLQTPLTTLPSLPTGAVIGGMFDFLGRLPQYAATVARNYRNAGRTGGRSLTRSAQEAFQEVFRELADYKVSVDPRLFDVDEDALAVGAAGVDKVFKSSQKYLDWLLAPFKAVETANRGIGFYATRRAGVQMMKTNPFLKPADLSEAGLTEYLNLWSARTVNATQFLPGGGSRTIAQDSVAPWLRVFTSFPTRFLSWMLESTSRGALVEAEMKTAGVLERMIGGRNFGTLGRLYVSGRVLQTGFRDVLGLDVNRWIGFGPVAPDQEMLGIFPVPPVAGVLLNIAKFISTGDVDDTQPLTIPGVGKIPIPRTLVPGGVALNRLGRAVEQFDSDAGGFVDEDQRLMRRSGVKDQIITMFGIPQQKARRERLQMASLRVRNQKIKDFRRRFGMSILQGDMRTAGSLQMEYAKTFPDMPPLNVAVHDLKTMQKNARIPRLAHRLRGLSGGQADFIRADLLATDPTMVLGVDELPTNVLP